MYTLLKKCINEIESHYHIQVTKIESDDEPWGISQEFVQPSVSGPFKTKLVVVERSNRTFKLIVGYNTHLWADLFPEALFYYNFEM